MRVAFIGKKGSGKTTAATSTGFRVMSFAGPIKELAVVMTNAALNTVQQYHGITRTFTYNDLEQNKKLFRPMLQWIGTEFGREYLANPDIWNWMMEDRMAHFHGMDIAIDDMRFLNEADWGRREGFVLIRITRDGIETIDTHASETELDQIVPDYEIQNNGTEEDLVQKVQDIIAPKHDAESHNESAIEYVHSR